MRKITDFKGDESFDFIADIAEPAGVILSDKDVRDVLFPNKNENKNENENETRSQKAFKCASIICRKYKREAAEILAVVNETTPDNLNLNPIEIIAQTGLLLTEIMTESTSFFMSLAPKTELTSSGLPSENTPESDG